MCSAESCVAMREMFNTPKKVRESIRLGVVRPSLRDEMLVGGGPGSRPQKYTPTERDVVLLVLPALLQRVSKLRQKVLELEEGDPLHRQRLRFRHYGHDGQESFAPETTTVAIFGLGGVVDRVLTEAVAFHNELRQWVEGTLQEEEMEQVGGLLLDALWGFEAALGPGFASADGILYSEKRTRFRIYYGFIPGAV